MSKERGSVQFDKRGKDARGAPVTIKLLDLGSKPLFESMISLHVYPLSYIFAEKLEAIVYRGDTNSRMKDFYDVLRISDLVEFDLIGTGPIVHAVFRHRKTTFMNKLYYDDEARKELTKSWGRFLTALDEEHRRNVPSSFADVVVRIDELLGGIGMAG